MKKASIISAIVIGSILVIIVGIYVSLQFYIFDESKIETNVSVDSFSIEDTMSPMEYLTTYMKYVTPKDWNKYDISIPIKDIDDEILNYAKTYIKESKLVNDYIDTIDLNEIKYHDDDIVADATLKKGFLRLPVKIYLNIIGKNNIIDVKILKIKLGWLGINPKWILKNNGDNFIIDLSDVVGEEIPIYIDSLSIDNQDFVMSISLDDKKLSTIVSEYVSNLSTTYSNDIKIPNLRHQQISIPIESIEPKMQENFDEYIKTESKKGLFNIESAKIDLANKTISATTSILFIRIDIDAEIDFSISNNIMSIDVLKVKINDSLLMKELVDVVEAMFAGFEYDLRELGMPKWITIHSMDIDKININARYSLEIDTIYEEGLLSGENTDFFAGLGIEKGSVIDIEIEYDMVQEITDKVIGDIVQDYDIIQYVTADIARGKADVLINLITMDMSVNMDFSIVGKYDTISIVLSQPTISVGEFDVPSEVVEDMFKDPIIIDMVLDELFPPESAKIYSIDFLEDKIILSLIF